ncbi:hypothetical protein [Hydrogenimonas sp.]
MGLFRKLFWLFVWGITFGFIESSVVVYLRALYYPEGFAFPLVPIEPKILINEIVREATTLLIIWATATLSFERMQSKVAAFFLLFGIWDIFYYVFLEIVLDWPASPMTWDILFLIPVPWVGPVWAPVLVAVTLVAYGIYVLKLNASGRSVDFDRKFVVLESIAGAIVVVSFILPGFGVLEGGEPKEFPTLLYWIGYLLGVLTFLKTFKRKRES